MDLPLDPPGIDLGIIYGCMAEGVRLQMDEHIPGDTIIVASFLNRIRMSGFRVNANEYFSAIRIEETADLPANFNLLVVVSGRFRLLYKRRLEFSIVILLSEITRILLWLCLYLDLDIFLDNLFLFYDFYDFFYDFPIYINNLGSSLRGYRRFAE